MKNNAAIVERQVAKNPKKRLRLILLGIVVLAGICIAILNRVEGSRRDTLVAELKGKKILMEIPELLNTGQGSAARPAASWKNSAQNFLYSPEAGGDPQAPNNARVADWPWYQVSQTSLRVFFLKPGEDKEICAVVAEHRPFLEKLRKVSLMDQASPEAMVEHTMSGRSIWTARLPNLLAARSFANLLVLDAYVCLKNGQADMALSDIGAILRLGQLIRNPTFLVSHLIGNAVHNIGLQGLAQIVPGTTFSESTLAELEKDLAKPNPRENLTRSYQFETLSIKLIYDALNGRGATPVGDLPGLLGGKSYYYYLYALPVFSFWRARDEIRGLGLFAEAVALSREPWYRGREERTRLESEIRALDWKTPVLHLAMPNWVGGIRSAFQTETLLRQARIAVALNRFQRASGAYPEALSALVPQFIQEVPTDPFTGREMPYTKGAKGFLLYSWGENGEAEALKSTAGQSDDKVVTVQDFQVGPGDDIVWGKIF